MPVLGLHSTCSEFPQRGHVNRSGWSAGPARSSTLQWQWSQLSWYTSYLRMCANFRSCRRRAAHWAAMATIKSAGGRQVECIAVPATAQAWAGNIGT